MSRKIILFVCIGNSGRGQMAEAFLKRIGGNTMNAMSAGINPDEEVHPKTVKTIKEVGISVEQAKPKRLTTEMVMQADRIVVMDSKVLQSLPEEYLAKMENWNIDALLGKSKAQVAEIRDEIRMNVEQLAKEEQGPPTDITDPRLSQDE